MRLLALLVLVACSKDEAPAERPALLSEGELKRAAEACKTYVDKVCACEAAAAKDECKLAKGMPEAVELAKRLASNPKADDKDAKQAASSVRKTVKECIERTAALATIGCP